MSPALLMVLHGDGHIDRIYFWSAAVMAAVPVGVFIIIAVLAARGYFRRRVADGGGEPPQPPDIPG